MTEESFQLSKIHRSQEIGKLVSALCKAQLSFDPILKESENPAFARKGKVSKYADLFSLVSATRKHLNANGLTLMQFPTVVVKDLVVTSMLAHESGEFISHELFIPAVDERGFTAHSIGKAMTYARRYSWQAITGAVAEDDDDGNEASGQGSHEAAKAVGEAKVHAAKNPIRQPEPVNQAREVQIKVLPNMDWAVTGFLEDRKVSEFLANIEAKSFIAKDDGRRWYKCDPSYLTDFKILLDKQEIGII